MKRLRAEESQKALSLLATAMSHLEARKIVKETIVQKLLRMNGKSK